MTLTVAYVYTHQEGHASASEYLPNLVPQWQTHYIAARLAGFIRVPCLGGYQAIANLDAQGGVIERTSQDKIGAG